MIGGGVLHVAAARGEGSEIHVLLVDLHADVAQALRQDGGELVQLRQVGGCQHHHGLAVIAGFLHQLLRLRAILLHRAKWLRFAGAANERRQARLLQRWIVADHRGQIIRRGCDIQQRPARLGVVERRNQAIRTDQRLKAERIHDLHLDRRILLQQRNKVIWHDLLDVDLPGAQRVQRGGGIGDVAELHGIDMRDAAAGHAARWLAARDIGGIAVEAPGAAGNPFVRFEHERAGADAGAHRLVRVGLRVGSAHDDRYGGGRIAQAGQQHRERFFQFDREFAGIGHDERVEALGQQPAVDGADRPSLERRDHVGAGDRRPVMERQAGTQDEIVIQAIRADAVALHHLRLRVEVLVEAEQRLIDEVGKILRGVGGGPGRIERSQVLRRRDVQRGLRACGSC